MSSATFRLVLLVSCAHALVHTFEFAFPSVEQSVADDYGIGTEMTGLLSTVWRVPWGFGALLAGWLVDHLGSRKMLTVYLLGCAATCAVTAVCRPLAGLFVSMAAMGALASIYHPAGLALISHETTAAQRPRALGVHGVFGSLGIGGSPFLVGMLLQAGVGWRGCYALLAVVGAACGVAFHFFTRGDAQTADAAAQQEAETTDWTSFLVLTTLAAIQGLVYSGVLTFLPRYLSGALSEGQGVAWSVYFTGGVLLIGCAGQMTAGRIARVEILEKQLVLATLANAPFLAWMALAEGPWRLAAAGCFAFVHFIYQPLYNSLVAKYTPRHRRSLCYGFSFAMGLGVGGLGAALAGVIADQTVTHAALAGATLLASAIGVYLWRRNAAAPA